MQLERFGEFLQQTHPAILVAIPVTVYAIGMLVIAIRYQKCVSLPDWSVHMVFVGFYSILLVASVAAWQFVTQETGQWIWVVAGTLISGITGYLFHHWRDQLQQRGKAWFGHLLWYLPLIGAIAWVGAHTFAEHMALTAKAVHPWIFVVVWLSLLILELLVGFFGALLIDRSLVPMVVQWQQRLPEVLKQEQDHDEVARAQQEKQRRATAREDSLERIRRGAVEINCRRLSRDPRLVEEDVAQLEDDLDCLSKQLLPGQLISADEAVKVLYVLYVEFFLRGNISRGRLKQIIAAVVDEIVRQRGKFVSPDDRVKLLKIISNLVDSSLTNRDYEQLTPLDIRGKLLTWYYEQVVSGYTLENGHTCQVNQDGNGRPAGESTWQEAREVKQ